MRTLKILLSVLLVVAMTGTPAATAAAPSCVSPAAFGLGLVQRTYGSAPHKDFEAVFTRADGGLSHYTRDNATGGFPWTGRQIFGSGPVDGAALIESGIDRRLQAMAIGSGQLSHFWQHDTGAWHGTGVVTAGVSGQPGFIEGASGNFEVVAPLAGGGLVHYWRHNAGPGQPWYRQAVFGAGHIYQAVALFQSSYGGGRNFEVVARTATTLHAWWRDAAGTWFGPTVLSGVAATGTHGFIQNRRWGAGDHKDFDLVVPLAGGGLAHMFRDNRTGTWMGPYTVDASGDYSAAALIHGSYGNLVAVARRGNEMVQLERADGTTWAWSPPYVFGAEAWCNATVTGRWADPVDTGMVGIHANLLPDGRVLWFGTRNDTAGASQGALFNPVTYQRQDLETMPNLFCSGHALTPDGRVWVSGGHVEARAKSHTFDPVTNTWQEHAGLGAGRWYPTNTVLPDGRVFTISGSYGGGPVGNDAAAVNNSWQIFNPATNTVSANVPVPVAFSPGFASVDLYPFVHVVPSGPRAGQLMVHSRATTRFLDVAANAWSGPVPARSPLSRTYPKAGTSVMLTLEPGLAYNGRVLAVGGAGGATKDDPAVRGAEVLDLGTAAPAWQDVAPMHEPRVMPDGVLLPDGKVFVVGGGRRGVADLAQGPVMTPEMFDPGTGAWTELAPMRVPRLYHATALLLPDARVLVAGRDGHFNIPPYQWPEKRAEIYAPPYLFAGPRPVITSAPPTWTYGSAQNLGVSTDVDRAVLIRLGSVTHSFDMGQRAVRLPITASSPGSTTVLAPPDRRVAPPGHYMVFVLKNGVPSVAKIVRLV
ncbi:galactose oxidase-like domain-containing protein [Nonomuraea typhae]|uniref:Galactose oxidase-like domain-containing protein n=1 Tax=Nonomuraea typhae TaxID=2603600 RepID=A0ABW7YUI3_9ACTN